MDRGPCRLGDGHRSQRRDGVDRAARARGRPASWRRLTGSASSACARFRFARSRSRRHAGAGLARPATPARTASSSTSTPIGPQALWEALLEAGRGDGLEPIGLGARDTLRLEAALPLYGHELDDRTSPLAAGLERFVKLDAEEFIGRAALLHEKERGRAAPSGRRRAARTWHRAPGLSDRLRRELRSAR